MSYLMEKMRGLRQLIAKIASAGTISLSFGMGTIFGAIVATLVSASLYGVLGYEASDVLSIKECLVEKTTTNSQTKETHVIH